MASIRRVGSLEIDQDHDYQRAMWKIQRVSWIVMVVILLAALAGLLGPGPLSRSSVEEPGGPLRVEYQRFEHLMASASLKVHVRPDRDDRARLWVGQDYLDRVSIERTEPPAERVEAVEDGSTFIFPIPEPSRSAVISFQIRARSIGPRTARVRLNGGPVLSFSQFVFP